MRFRPRFLAMVLPVLPLLAGRPGGAVLDYRIELHRLGDPAPEDLPFRLVTTPPRVTGNKVQQPRLGGWRIEGQGRVQSPVLLARALGLCYFSGPAEQMAPLAQTMTIGGRRCRLWRVQTPPGAGAYVYLAEVAPHLLALAYLSATRPGGDLLSVEIHLTGMTVGPRAVPAEEGRALLRTLQHWTAFEAWGADPGAMETQAVP
jgi:hypothetical protein